MKKNINKKLSNTTTKTNSTYFRGNKGPDLGDSLQDHQSNIELSN